MSDLPKSVRINEEGPREGFQIEKGPIATARKIELIDSLSLTGLKQIQCVSFVNPKNVPGWADAEEVSAGFRKHLGVSYTCLWLNDKGLKRAIATGRYDMRGSISLTASEKFLKRNQNRTLEQNYAAQAGMIGLFRENGIRIDRASMMAAFGCNFEGDMPTPRILQMVEQVFRLASEHDLKIKLLSLADTMAWATPATIKRIVGAVRDKYPDLELALHLHDTRGMGIANAYAGLEMGVAIYRRRRGGPRRMPVRRAQECGRQRVHRGPRLHVRGDGHRDRGRPAQADRERDPGRGHCRTPAARLGERRRQPRRPARADQGGAGGVILACDCHCCFLCSPFEGEGGKK